MAWLGLNPVRAQEIAPTDATSFHRLVLCTDGTVKGWGRNMESQLGTASTGATVMTPTVVPLANPAIVVRTATSYNASFAVGAAGSVWSWGNNANGRLGIGSSNNSFQTATPLQVTGLANVVSVNAGAYQTAALCTDGTVWTWGNGARGELGTGNLGFAYSPQQIAPTALHDIRQVACGHGFTLALDAAGHVWAWGHNISGALGIGATPATIQPTPVQVPGLSNIRFIQADDYSAAAIATDGSVYDWGNNTGGELGLGHSNFTSSPALVGQFPGAMTIALAQGSAIVVKADGSTVFWGNNNLGQRGNGSPSPSFCPLPTTGPTGLSPNVQLIGFNAQFMSIENTGAVKTWGYHANSPLGYTPTTPGVDGGSCVPTAPTDICLSVPTAGFVACAPQQRAFYQRPGATYVAAQHGYTVSPAEIGTYGQLTTIDVSQAPYNGTLAFNGVYRVRGSVRFINGTVTTTNGTIFYVDDVGGYQYSGSYYPNYSTAIEVVDADLRLSNSVLQGQCPGSMWGGVVLGTNGKIHTFNGGRPERRCTIQDAIRGVYSATTSSQYYLTYTNFSNNEAGLYDVNYGKNAAQAGEGVQACSFTGNTTRTTDIGIFFEPWEYIGGNFGGDYTAASFTGNTFTNLRYGIRGFAGNALIQNSTFTNNSEAAIYSWGYGGPIKVRNNTVTLPAAVANPAVTTTCGFDVGPFWQLENNTIRCLTAVGSTGPLTQVGVRLNNGNQTVTGNTFLNLDRAMDIACRYGSTLLITGNTLTACQEGILFHQQFTSGSEGSPAPTITLRCNSFSSSLAGAVGVRVKASTLFPAALGSASQPNGNNFSGIADATKRFVYDATTSFQYYRYNSTQEALGGAGNSIYSSTSSNPSTIALVPTPFVSGNGACGTSSATPGVYARPAAGSPDGHSALTGELSPARLTAYPNPARDIVAFAYVLPSAATTGQVLLRDLMGRVVKMATTGQTVGEVQLLVAALPAGFYTATLEFEGRAVATQKLAVQR